MVGVISDCKAENGIPHRTACAALGMSESWYYKWRGRPPTVRDVRRQQLAEEIEEIFRESGGTYGSPKVFIELVRRGRRMSVNTVAKLMAELGPAGRKARCRRSLTRPGKRPAAPDFVRRDFTAEEPDLVWVGDLTEIDTQEGKLYLATVIDLFSRRLLGYPMGERHDAELVVASLNMAAATRGGDVRGVIMHTDRGSEYTSRRFKRACRGLGIVQSMGRVGSCFDNAVSEAFNSVLKVEYVHRHHFATRTEARIKIATWITDFYNTRRLHSVCDFKSPIDYEREYRAGLLVGPAAYGSRGLTQPSRRLWQGCRFLGPSPAPGSVGPEGLSGHCTGVPTEERLTAPDFVNRYRQAVSACQRLSGPACREAQTARGRQATPEPQGCLLNRPGFLSRYNGAAASQVRRRCPEMGRQTGNQLA